MQKCLILLAFVSYEAVRLWWWGGNGGVVSFEKIRYSCSSPTTGTKSKRLCAKVFPGQGVVTDTKTDTNFAADA
jgi:hypothetical protein